MVLIYKQLDFINLDIGKYKLLMILLLVVIFIIIIIIIIEKTTAYIEKWQYW